MRKLFLALAFCFCIGPALADSLVVQTCGTLPLAYKPGTSRFDTVDVNGVKCTSAGGGGGGLSVLDASSWTFNVSNFTPTGGVFNNSATALTSGQQGTVRLNANREMHVDCDIANVLCGLINSPSPAIAGTTPTSQGAVGSGTTSKIQTDVNGNLFIAPQQIFASGPATTALSLSVIKNSQYPVNSVTTTPAPITGNATGSSSAVVGTLAAAASKTTFICGFNISSLGGAATIGPVTVAGLIGSSQIYQLPVNATAGQILVTQNFNPCIPASAVNTAITITTTADGTATAVDVNSWGYQL